MHPGAKALRAPAAAAVPLTRVATVPLQALKLYGNGAVFATLPPSTLGPRRGRRHIGLGRRGPVHEGPAGRARRTGDDHRAAGAEGSRDAVALLGRVKDYQQIVVPPADARRRPEGDRLRHRRQRDEMRARIDADRTVPARLAQQPRNWAAGGRLRRTASSQRLHQRDVSRSALVARLRYVVPRTFDRVMAYPQLPFPLSRKLEMLAPDVFLPGVGVLPSDFIMAVKTNPRFVEALMVGANHEMGREMLWQGLPTDQRGTPFQHFWQRLDGEVDIEPMHHWNAVPLGEQPGSTAMLVLLFRGRLLERYPNLTIYAYPMNAVEEKGPGANEAGAQMLAARIELPVLRGRLLNDIHYVGFQIEPKDIAGYFFIVEEHMTEPRFGFDERVGNGQDSASWQDVDWDDIGVGAGRLLRARQPAAGASRRGPGATRIPPRWRWPRLQRPFRGYWRGAALKMP